MSGLMGEVKHDSLVTHVSTTVTRGLVAIHDGLNANGEPESKVSDVAGTVIPLGIYDHSATSGQTARVTRWGRLTGISGAALAAPMTELSYDNAGKLVAATLGTYIVGHNLSTTSGADEEVTVEFYQSPHLKP